MLAVVRYVEYSDPLVRFIEGQLASAFALDYLSLSRCPNNCGNDFYVQLVDTATSARLDSGYEQGVMEIVHVKRRDTFYFSFVAPFDLVELVDKRRRRYALFSLSLTVFHRVLEELVPMFRAEWHRQDVESDTSPHAQPHWHAVQSPKRIERLVRSRLNRNGASDFRPEQDETSLFLGVADFEMLHLAMNSSWITNTAFVPKLSFDEPDFKTWFVGLTKYIAKQIEYLADKMPSVGSTLRPSGPAPFVP